MSIEFPLLKKHTSLGEVSLPKIPVSVKTKKGFQMFPFLLDAGADFTMMPSSMRHLLDAEVSQSKSLTVYGIEGGGVLCSVIGVVLKIAEVEFEVTSLISSKDTTPFILGRMDFFSRFNITFDNKNQKIILDPI